MSSANPHRHSIIPRSSLNARVRHSPLPLHCSEGVPYAASSPKQVHACLRATKGNQPTPAGSVSRSREDEAPSAPLPSAAWANRGKSMFTQSDVGERRPKWHELLTLRGEHSPSRATHRSLFAVLAYLRLTKRTGDLVFLHRARVGTGGMQGDRQPGQRRGSLDHNCVRTDRSGESRVQPPQRERRDRSERVWSTGWRALGAERAPELTRRAGETEPLLEHGTDLRCNQYSRSISYRTSCRCC